MSIPPLLVYRELVLTLICLILFWILYAGVYKTDFLRWWGLAWTSFVVYLAINALLLSPLPAWRNSLILISVLARFLQIPLLVVAAWTMRLEEQRPRRWRTLGIVAAIGAAAITFAASFAYRDQPILSYSLRSLPHTLGIAAALFFFAQACRERWRQNRALAATVLTGTCCFLYGVAQILFGVGYIQGLSAGANALLKPDSLALLAAFGIAIQRSELPMLVHPAVFLFGLISNGGVCLGMMILIFEESQQDLLSRREAERRNRQLAEADADLVEHSEDLICSHDLDGRLLSVNSASARILGYQVEELLGISVREFLAPRFRNRFDGYIARIQRKGAASGSMAVVSRLGEERIWQYHNILRFEGDRKIIRGLARDVTEKMRAERDLRRSEAKFSTAFRANPSAMMITRLSDGVFIDVNDAFERQTGYNRFEVHNLTALQLGIWMDVTEWQRVERELQNGKGVKSCEMRLQTRTKDILTISYSAEVIAVGGAPLVLAVAEDITTRKQAEEKLRDLSSRLVRAQEEERARIARELHDDVNQRLTVLGMRLEQLKISSVKMKSSDVEKLDALWKLTSEISADVRRVSHGLHPALLDFVDLPTAISELCREFGKVNEMQIGFVHDHVPPNLPKDVVLCFYRVAQEAIRNAQQHSGCRQARVELSGGSDQLRLRVSDSGLGFDPTQVHGDRLGLLSMAERLRSLRGDLSVQSRAGEGTSIEARVPIS